MARSEVDQSAALKNGEGLAETTVCKVQKLDEPLLLGNYHPGTSRLYFWHCVGNFCERKKQLILFTHDACHFATASGLWEMLATDRAILIDEEANKGKGWAGQAIISDPPTVLRFRLKDAPGVIKLLDVRNFGYHGARDGKNARERCHHVVHFVVSWMEMLARMKLGGFQDTAASQAQHGFRASYMGDTILVHNNLSALRLERETCHPGRTECFRLGRTNGPIYQLDIASCYPAVSRNADLPARLRHSFGKDRVDIGSWIKNGWCAIAAVTVENARAVYPLMFS